MKTLALFFVCLLCRAFIAAHAGHDHNEALHAQQWIQWIGSFHFVFLHFPIAVIYLLVFSEALLAWQKTAYFESISHFSITCGAIFTPLTALLGLIYSYSSQYTGSMEIFLLVHMCLGLLAAILIVYLAIYRKEKGPTAVYYAFLILLFLMVNVASFFGGALTFGLNNILPPGF